MTVELGGRPGIFDIAFVHPVLRKIARKHDELRISGSKSKKQGYRFHLRIVGEKLILGQ